MHVTRMTSWMSNALLSFLASGASARADGLLAAAGVQQCHYGMYVLMALGLLVLALLAVLTWANPRKLSLAGTPGRPNRLSPMVILPLFLVFMMSSGAAAKLRPEHVGLFGKLTQAQAALLGNMIIQMVVLLVSLLLAERCFSLGAVKGMGLRAGHWIYGTLQAVIAYLAIYPVCYGLQQLMIWALNHAGHADWVQEHPMILQLQAMSPVWQGVIVISTVALAPVLEEVFFRGLFQSMLKHHTQRPWLSILATSALFAILHPLRDMAAIFAFSVLLGYLYERTGKLYASIVTHVLFNAMSILFVLTAA